MGIKVDKIFIETNNKADFVSFITQVLDLEIISDEVGEDYFVIDNLKVQLLSGQGSVDGSRMTIFPSISIEVETQKDLEELQQKVEFYYYRQKIADKKPRIEKFKHISYFEVRDPDNRSWRIELKNFCAHQQASEQEKQFIN